MLPVRVRCSLIRFVRPSRCKYVATSCRSSDLKLILRTPVKRQPSAAVSPTTYAISSDHSSASVVLLANGHLHSSKGVLRSQRIPRWASAIRATLASVCAVSPFAQPFPTHVSTHGFARSCCHTKASIARYFVRQARVVCELRGHHCAGDGRAILAGPLRLVESAVRQAERIRARACVLGNASHADREARRWGFASDRGERLVVHRAADPFGRDQAARRVRLGLDDGVLVATDARDDIARAHLAAKKRCDVLQQAVSLLVPKAVVHELEPVRVEQEESQAAFVT